MAGLDAEAARGFLGSLLRDFPRPLGAEDALPWSPPGRGGALSLAEAPAEMADLARGFLGSRLERAGYPYEGEKMIASS
ncbi:UNVERIFIED_CONTAM: hypothetical protein K2H54_020297 [Gekko kuhli]